MSALPAGYVLRPARPDEAAAIAALICAADSADGAEPDTETSDILSFWREFDPTMSALVVEADSKVVAYADVVADPASTHIDGYVHPEVRGRGLGAGLLRAAEDLATAGGRTELPLRATIISGAEDAMRLLEQEGYGYLRSFFRMAIELGAAPPEPAWRPGIEVRQYVSGPDDELMHETLQDAFQDHWDFQPRSLEDFVRTQAQDEQLVPTASFIATAEGDTAGAVLSKRRFGAGLIGSLGVRPPWRRRGLGQALLLHAFGSFYGLGERSIKLGVDAESTTGATRLYERVGMEVEVRYDTYERPPAA